MAGAGGGSGAGGAALPGPARIAEGKHGASGVAALPLASSASEGKTRGLGCDSPALGLKCYGGHTLRLLGMKAQPPKRTPKDYKSLAYGQVVILDSHVADVHASFCLQIVRF
ncbi:unnamed protein product [Coccothraustes coccothraustes]